MAKVYRSPALYEGVKRFIRTNDLIRRGNKVFVALSGGIDSVVLLDLLSTLSAEWKLEIGILHVNHLLRGKESDTDERFVRSLATRYGFPLAVARVETKKEAAKKRISIQEAARNLRYSFFLIKKSELRADAVATAHNANDNAETVLLNLFRGTGIDGLAGIPVRRENDSIIRPLLFATRAEIAAYAQERKLRYREDSSNKSDKYSRNFLRRNVIPLLERRVNPSIVQVLTQSSAVFRIASEKEGEILFDKRELKELHPYMRQMVVHEALLRKHIEPSYERIAIVLSLLDAEKGARVDCGDGWRAENEAHQILLTRRDAPSGFSFLLREEGTVATDFFSLVVRKCADIPNKLGAHSSTEYIDARTIRFPMLVRSWKNGDSFVPLGMKRMKKLSDLFVDLKISRSKKNRIPIVESDGKIVWVAGLRLDDRYKITSTTTEAYKLSLLTHE